MFNWKTLITGIIKNVLSPRTWAWLVASALAWYGVHQDGEHVWLSTLIICWCVISVFFLGGKAFQDALNTMVRDRMDVDIKVGKDANI